MLIHHIKVALRNLLKYKTQTILSIVGLAIGFACFALSVTWIRYEMSYDTFHPNGDRIYAVNATQNGVIVKDLLNRPLIDHFQKTFPEVELATMVEYGKLPLEGDKSDTCIYFLETDSAFQKMFPFPFESNLYHQPTTTGAYPMVVTRGTAKLLAGKKGLNGAIYDQREIVGTMKAFPVNSRFHCDAIATIVPTPQVPDGGGYSRNFIHAPNYLDFFVQLKEGSNAEDFAKKISTLYYLGDSLHFTLVPLNELHYRLPDPNTSYKFSHIILFAGAGALVILCALFNYITLFVTRISIRGREIALRKVNGASNSQLFLLFTIEFLLLILMALFIGECLVELCIPKFITLSGILLTRGAIYGETIVYALLLILISFIVGIIPICYFRSKTLQASIQSQTGPARNLFRKATLILQLIISIGLFFATTVLFKQVHYMTNEGAGFDSRNVWYAEMMDYNVHDYADKIAQIPYVTEINKECSGFFPGYGVTRISNGTQSYCLMRINRDFIRFHKLTVLAGEPFKEGEKNVIMINESMLKLQENETRESIIGKQVMYGNVVGVIKNFYSGSQTEEQEPIIFFPTQEKQALVSVLYRVMDGKAKEANEAIHTLLEKETGCKEVEFQSMEEHLEKAYRSERALLYMLGIITGVCILISIFGIYSMVSLTCQQRRKEIAIRKVFGATVAQILHSFFREYALLLGIAALIAFPMASYLMHLWLEQYVRQTSIDGWIHLVIMALVALIILITIGSRVWKAASANPAEVVKSE